MVFFNIQFTNKTLAFLILPALLSISFATPAENYGLTEPPELAFIDEGGANLLAGELSISKQDLSIGNGVSSLEHNYSSVFGGFASGFEDSFYTSIHFNFTSGVDVFNLPPSYKYWLVNIGSQTHKFKALSNGTFQAWGGDGSTLIKNTNAKTWTYTSKNGTQLILHYLDGAIRTFINLSKPAKIIKPNGVEITIYRGLGARIESVVSNTGLQLKYNYASNTKQTDPSKYRYPISIQAINNAVEYCSPTAFRCSLQNAWPTVNYTWPTHSQLFSSPVGSNAYVHVTTPENVKTTYRHTIQPIYNGNSKTPKLTGIKDSTSSGAYTSTYDYGDYQACIAAREVWSCSFKWRVLTKIQSHGATWTYNYDQPRTPYRTTARGTGPRGSTSVVMANGSHFPWRFHATTPDAFATYNQNQANLPKTVSANGESYSYIYGPRNNLVERRQKDYKSSGLPDLIEKANYTSSCSNLKVCNQPTWTRDAKGYQTDYQYHAQSGQISKITLPADKDGIRPQIRYFYTQKYAYYKNSSGNIVRASKPVWLLTKTSECMKGNANGNGCALANDEIVTHYDYGKTNVANNLWLKGMTLVANGQTRRTCYTYDNYGNRLSETQPNANLASCQ